MEYKIIENNDLCDLTENINEQLKEWWKLQWWVSVAYNNFWKHPIFIQAITK